MQFPLQLIAALAASVAQTQARPPPLRFDYSPVETNSTIFERQFTNCGEDTISCNGEATGGLPELTPVSVCQRVIDSLQDNEIRTKPRDHCITDESGQYAGSRCCITWSHEVPRDSPYSEFRAVAQSILDTCVSRDNSDGAHISGQMHRVEIGGKCMQVCLSPKTKGCAF
ncbi:hypothetical protein CC79DRAFT_1373989 [Sarocladium strictum]